MGSDYREDCKLRETNLNFPESGGNVASARDHHFTTILFDLNYRKHSLRRILNQIWLSDEEDINEANESFRFGGKGACHFPLLLRKDSDGSIGERTRSDGVLDEDVDNLKKEKIPTVSILARWLDEPDENGRIGVSHFRNRLHLHCS